MLGLVPPGHKVAVRAIAAGSPVRRYNQIIGFATRDIRAGEHVHLHNLGIGVDMVPTSATRRATMRSGPMFTATPAVAQPATFMGIVRADGRVATRNYVGILSSVNCSATVARAIADRFRRDLFPDALAPFPNIDGVIALTHGTGCGMDMGDSMRVLRRTLAGYARHPNFAAVSSSVSAARRTRLRLSSAPKACRRASAWHATTCRTSAAPPKRSSAASRWCARCCRPPTGLSARPVPASHLMLGLQCGGSDGYSGITANPALGNAVDRLVAHGGTAILSETPEIYGAEHLLTRRAVSREVGETADRAHQVVGGLHRAQPRRDEQQSIAGQ